MPTTTSKRKRQPGSMRERSPGHWELRAFSGRHVVTGKPTQRTQTFSGTEHQAAKALAAFVTKVGASAATPTGHTVGQLLDKWLDAVEPRQTPKTFHENRRKIDTRIRPALGEVKLSKLDAALLDSLYNAWEKEGLSPQTVLLLHRILSAACNRGVKWGWLDRAPTMNATPPDVPRHEYNIPTPAQLRSMIQAAEDFDPVLAAAVALAALTGARRGELAALRWSDLDLTAGKVKIARSLTVVGGSQHTGTTKTHAARTLALDPFCVEVLRWRWDFMVELSNRAESPLVADPYVLSYNGDGATPAGPDTITHRFSQLCVLLEKPALEQLKVTKPKATRADLAPADRWPFRFHDLRHFSVTTLIAAGVDVRTVADRHGHAKATMTLDRYAHALPERDREAAGVLGAALTL